MLQHHVELDWCCSGENEAAQTPGTMGYCTGESEPSPVLHSHCMNSTGLKEHT